MMSLLRWQRPRTSSCGVAGRQVAAGVEVGHDRGPRREPIEPVVARPCPGDGRVVGQDGDRREAVAQAGLVVVVVVRRGDLDGPRPERAIDDLVGDDRNVAVDERDANQAPDQRGIALVVGVDRDGRVTEDRLRAGRGDRDRRGGVGPAGRRVDQVVADRPERARLGRRHDLEVAHARLTTRTPVDERLGPVGEVRLVEPLEGDPDGARRAVVHRVAQPAPVERPADPSLLAEHDLAGRGDELAHPLQVAVAPERTPALPFPGEDAVEDELRRDRGVVETRQEERAMTAHPGVADHQVLDRGPLGMPEVERTRHVGGRLDDRERRERRVGGRAGAVGGEDIRREPALVDRALDIVRRIGLRQIRHRRPRNRTTRSSSGRTGRGTTCWFSGGSGRSSRLGLPDALSTRYRASPVRLASDVHVGRPTRLAPSRARSGAVPSLLFPVIAVRPECSTGSWPFRHAPRRPSVQPERRARTIGLLTLPGGIACNGLATGASFRGRVWESDQGYADRDHDGAGIGNTGLPR